jgi:hypothetical protein
MDICKSIKESLETRYSLAGLDEFIVHEDTKKPKMFYINITYTDSEEVANIAIFISSLFLDLGMLERISANPAHKGIVRKIIQLAICKAVQLNLPIHFKATPGVGKYTKHVSKNKTKLYKYYNNLGFTRVKNQEPGDEIYYETPVEKLKEIMASWAPASPAAAGGGTCGISRKRRATRKSRR